MFRHLKYALLVLLLRNICNRSECENCTCACQVKLDIGENTWEGRGCEHQDILYQARKVWRIKK